MAETTMDAASYELWIKLRTPWVRKLRRQAIKVTASSVLWGGMWILAAERGLLGLGLIALVLWLAAGIPQALFADCKDDKFEWFAPAFFFLSPFAAAFVGIGRLVRWAQGEPLVPTMLSGRGLVSITPTSEAGEGYRFTMASGLSTSIMRDRSYEQFGVQTPVYRSKVSVGPLEAVVVDLDLALSESLSKSDEQS